MNAQLFTEWSHNIIDPMLVKKPHRAIPSDASARESSQKKRESKVTYNGSIDGLLPLLGFVPLLG